MKPKNATLDDVARHAGVSYQTVSRVLNRSRNVAPATRLKVEQSISALNYVPNRMAQQLAGKSSATLGLVTTSLGFHAPSQIAAAIKIHAQQAGYNVLIAMVNEDLPDGLQAAVNELQAQRVDGIIINLPLDGPQAEALSTNNGDMACLFLDVPPDAGVFHVMFNPDDGTRESVDHLFLQGHRQFALLSGPMASVSARLRLQSWQRALQERGLTAAVIGQGDWTAQSGYLRTLEMRHQCAHFTAMLVGNDQMSLGVISALQQQNVAVPAQVSVIGYDDTRDSAFFLPALTTVSQDFNQLGQEAVTRLVSMLGNPAQPHSASVMLPTHLVVRHSTAAPIKGADLHHIADSLQQIVTALRGI